MHSNQSMQDNPFSYISFEIHVSKMPIFESFQKNYSLHFLNEDICNLFKTSNLAPQLQIIQNDKVWKTWFDKDAPEEAPFPLTYNALDTFRKLLIVR